MSKRYNVLKPVTVEVLEDFTLQMINFFQPPNDI